MPSSTVLSLADPEQYATNARGGIFKELVTACGLYEAQLTKIDLHHLWMRRGRKSLPIISHTVAQSRSRQTALFSTIPRPRRQSLPRSARGNRCRRQPMPMIRVTLLAGRAAQQKQEFAEAVTEAFVRICGSTRHAVEVVYENIERENWVIGGAPRVTEAQRARAS
jgi:4-oxalocrotonate tautomerase